MSLIMVKNAILASALLTSFAWLSGCNRERPVEVSLDRPLVLNPSSSAKGPKPLRLGMGAMITPKDGYLYYHDLKEYLAQKIGRPIELVDRDNYTQISKMLEKRELEIGFVGTGTYVEGHDSYGLEIIAVPETRGRATNHAYTIVPKASSAKELLDLRGTTFAFTDPKSNTGKLVPTYVLAQMGKTPETFFKKAIYTYGHDRSIKAVAEHFVDGASVDSLIWELYVRSQPETTAKVKIIAKSPPYGSPPLVAVPGTDPALKKALRSALLAMHTDPAGRQILTKMNIDRFVLQPDKAYDSIRQMKARVELQKVKK